MQLVHGRSGWLLAVVLSHASLAAASTIAVPSFIEDVAESAINTPLRSAARSYQEYIDASELTAITEPVFITGVQYRLAIGENWRPAGYAGTSWPNVPLSFTRYDIELSQSAGPLVTTGQYSGTSTSFATYQGSDVTMVRSGPMTVPAGAFQADGGAAGTHSFGAVIPFTTPYLYTPGTDLVMMIRASAYTGGAPQAFFAMHTFAPNIADAIHSTASASAVNPSQHSAPAFLQFTYQVPEPVEVSMLTALPMFARRRRRP